MKPNEGMTTVRSKTTTPPEARAGIARDARAASFAGIARLPRRRRHAIERGAHAPLSG